MRAPDDKPTPRFARPYFHRAGGVPLANGTLVLIVSALALVPSIMTLPFAGAWGGTHATGTALGPNVLRSLGGAALRHDPSGLSVQSWLNLSGGLGNSPPSRWGAAACFDPADGYDLVFGGISSTGVYLRDTWAYANGRWSSLTPSSLTSNNTPSARDGAAISYDPVTRAVYLFGGRGTAGAMNDTWQFDGGNWTNVTGAVGTAPARRAGAGMAFDASLGGLVLVAGRTSNLLYRDDWSFTGTAWVNLTPALQNTTNFPPRLYNLSLGADATDGSVVLFGGLTYTAGSYVPYNGTWQYASGTWTELSAGSHPSARSSASIAWDAAASELVLTGGDGPTGGEQGDVWTFSSGVWSLLAPGAGAAPSARSGSVLVPGAVSGSTVDGYLLLFGGQNSRSAALGDSWVFGSAPLTATVVSASPPVVDLGQSSNLSVLVFGGSGAYSFVWSLPTGCVGASAAAVRCTPDQTGRFHPSVTVSDGTSSAPVTASGTMVVNLPPAILSFIATPYSALVGNTSVSFVVTATGGTGHLEYAYSGLPYGCVSNNSAVITCTPNATGTYGVVVVVTDTTGAATSAKTSLVVTTPSPATGWGRVKFLELGASVFLAAFAVIALVYYVRKRRSRAAPSPAARPPSSPGGAS